MSAKYFLKRVFGFFFPNICVSCGRIIGENDRMCKECRKNLIKINLEKACPLCGLEKPNCACRHSVYYFAGIVSCYYNEGSAKNIVYNYKLGHRDYYADFIAADMAVNLKEKFGDIKFDYITSVPPTVISRLKKGFDQTKLLAKQIGKLTKIPVRNDVVGCKPIAVSQHTSDMKERFINVKDKYYVKKKVEADNVLLVDDIKTTGATIDACARELLYSGARRVYCITVLTGRKKHDSPTKLKK